LVRGKRERAKALREEKRRRRVIHMFEFINGWVLFDHLYLTFQAMLP
jgi:hypothetical protein